MLVEVIDARLDRPVLTPGVVPMLSRTPGHVPPLAPPVGGDSEAILGEIQAIGATCRSEREVAA